MVRGCQLSLTFILLFLPDRRYVFDLSDARVLTMLDDRLCLVDWFWDAKAQPLIFVGSPLLRAYGHLTQRVNDPRFKPQLHRAPWHFEYITAGLSNFIIVLSFTLRASSISVQNLIPFQYLMPLQKFIPSTWCPCIYLTSLNTTTPPHPGDIISCLKLVVWYVLGIKGNLS